MRAELGAVTARLPVSAPPGEAVPCPAMFSSPALPDALKWNSLPCSAGFTASEARISVAPRP